MLYDSQVSAMLPEREYFFPQISINRILYRHFVITLASYGRRHFLSGLEKCPASMISAITLPGLP